MIGIIGATDFEMVRVLGEMDVFRTETHGGFVFKVGVLFGREIVAVKAGIGKVFASSATMAMILNYKIDMVLNIGASGGLLQSQNMGDVVLVTETVQYDMDTTAFGDPLGLISGINKVFFELSVKDGFCELLKENNINCVVGKNATADLFCTEKSVKEMLIKDFDSVSVEMECGAMAQICYLNDMKFESIKIISDGANDNSNDDYNEYTGTVGDRVMEILELRFSIC